MATFVLLHGPWHGPWCWERVTPEIERQGHRVIAPELAYHNAAATAESMVADVEAVITDPGDTILVSHSASGLVAPVVAERLPLRELVLVASMLPAAGRSFCEQLAVTPGILQPEFVAVTARQPLGTEGEIAWGGNDAYTFFYEDCHPRDAIEAIRRLRPLNATDPFVEKTSLTGHSSVPTRFVVCSLDRVLSASWARRLAAERFQSSVVKFASSHSPFWSRPVDLAKLLTQGHRAGPLKSLLPM